MMPKPYSVVYRAWKVLNDCCDVSDGHNGENCLIDLAKDSLQKFMIFRRNVDVGSPVSKFPIDKKKYNKKQLQSALEKIDAICQLCGGYHNECCQVSNARKVVELLIFGKFHLFQKMPFGEYLSEKGVIERIQVVEAYNLQKEINFSFPTAALAMGLLTAENVLTVFRRQRVKCKEFDEIALDLKLINKVQVEQIKKSQKRAYRFIGEVLVGLEYLSLDQKNILLGEFQKKKEANPLASAKKGRIASY